MNARPIIFTWTDEGVMRPAPYSVRQCDKEFVVGESYPLVVHEDRSTNSHNHYFAAVHEAWKQLPERLSSRYPTSEHLRKAALIQAGFCDEEFVVCASLDDALRAVALIRHMDDYAVVDVSGNVVRVFRAKSQKLSSMDRKTFQDSKEKVLDIVAGLIGSTTRNLVENTGRAA